MSGAPLQILIVDDDPVIRKVLEQSVSAEPRLAALGVKVRTAADGKKALALIEAEKPDVVITDLVMPRMDGFALARALRKSPATDSLPIIVISGVYKDAAQVAEFQAEVLAKFLPKPLKAELLADTILELVRSAKPSGGTITGVATIGPATGEDPLLAGSMTEMAVPKLLLGHLEAGSTGTIVLVRGQQKKELFLRNGRTVGSESNMRQEALGNLLVSRGVIDEDQLNFLLAEAKRRGMKMGEVIVELGWLSPEDVLRFLGAQARKRVADCLRWNDGTYTFAPGDQFNERVIEHDFDVVKLIFTALQRTASPDALVAHLDANGPRPLRLSHRFERYREAFESVYGGALRPLLDDAPTVGSLILRPDSAQLILGIEALILTGLADLGEAPAQADAWEHVEVSDAFSLKRLGGEQPPALSSANLPEIDMDFDEGGHAPADDVQAAVPVAMLDMQDSGVVTLGPSSNLAMPSMGTLEDKRQAILREYLAIHGKSLYEVLGVPTDATREQLTGAYEEKTERFSPELFPIEELGADAPKFTAVTAAYDRAFRVLCDPGLRKGYDDALRLRGTEADALGAELAFNEGLALVNEGKFEIAIVRFEAAIKARSDQAAYRAYLGWSLWKARGPAALERARKEMQEATKLDPDLVDGHLCLGRFLVDVGDDDSARQELERAIELDPTRLEAVDLLISLYTKVEEHHASERLYRRVLGALGEKALPVRRQLWRDLAELYEREFADFSSARIAYDMAARLAPDDLALQRKVVELNKQDLGRWRELSRAVAAEWRLRPDDLALGQTLLDLFLRVDQADAATLAAAALVLRGSTAPAVLNLAENHRPRLLGRIQVPLDATILAKLRHPGEDADLETLFALLSEEGLLPPFSDEELGVEPTQELEAQRLPGPFGRVLRYVCGLFAVPQPPRLFVYEPLAADARLADTRPLALLVGPQLLESTDTVELGFRLGRALSFATPGRIAGSSRSGRQLRPYLLASMSLARRNLPAAETENFEEVRQQLDAARPPVRARLADLGGRLVRDRAAINLSSWARALSRTATRIGLLISADPLRVGRAVAEEEGPESTEDLMEFLLSLEHIDLRTELGLAAVV